MAIALAGPAVVQQLLEFGTVNQEEQRIRMIFDELRLVDALSRSPLIRESAKFVSHSSF
jgi:hypothetical protein